MENNQNSIMSVDVLHQLYGPGQDVPPRLSANKQLKNYKMIEFPESQPYNHMKSGFGDPLINDKKITPPRKKARVYIASADVQPPSIPPTPSQDDVQDLLGKRIRKIVANSQIRGIDKPSKDPIAIAHEKISVAPLTRFTYQKYPSGNKFMDELPPIDPIEYQANMHTAKPSANMFATPYFSRRIEKKFARGTKYGDWVYKEPKDADNSDQRALLQTASNNYTMARARNRMMYGSLSKVQ